MKQKILEFVAVFLFYSIIFLLFNVFLKDLTLIKIIRKSLFLGLIMGFFHILLKPILLKLFNDKE